MAPSVKIGLNIVWVRTELLAEFAQLAESLGFESLWSGEHICLSTDPDWWRLFPGAAALGDAFTEDMVPFTPDSNFPERVSSIPKMAGRTCVWFWWTENSW